MAAPALRSPRFASKVLQDTPARIYGVVAVALHAIR